MRLLVVAGIAIVTVLAAGCGSSGGSATGEEPGDAGCVDPSEGQACAAGEHACQPHGDVCCVGYTWICGPSSKTWTKEGLGCACDLPAPDAGSDGDAAGGDEGGGATCGDSTCAPGDVCVATVYMGGACIRPEGGALARRAR
jgi:hypothetical protein